MKTGLKYLTLVCLCAPAALAQAQEASETDEVFELSTVTVTATRRETSLQEVPLAVTAIDDTQIENQGIVDFTSLSRLAPSLTASNAQSPTNSNVLNIRGVGTSSNNLGFESAVGIFIDGAYQSRAGVALSEFVDVERVEVLRGPQGTLFGRNTSAGALTITTKSPELSGVSGFVNATYGDYDLVNVQGALSIPIIEDKLAARLTGALRQRDGYITDLSGDVESNDIDQTLLRGQFKYAAQNGLEARFIADYSDADSSCCVPIEVQSSPLEAGGVYTAVGLGARGGLDQPNTGLAALDDAIASSDRFPFSETEQWGITTEIKYPVNENAELIYIGSYRQFESLEGGDFDFTMADVASADFILTDIETTTHELRLQGSTFDDRLDYLIGAFYSDEDISQDGQTTLRSDYDAYVGAFIFPLTGGILGASPLTALSGGISPEGAFANNVYSQESASWSIFTHNTLAVTDALDLTLGLRYVDESKDGSYAQPAAQNDTCVAILGNLGTLDPSLAPVALGLGCFPFATPADLPGSGVPGGLPTPATFNDTFEDDALVYTVKAAYNFADGVNAYASFTRGYKAGGFNLDSTAAINGADPRFAAETVDAYEVGLKSSLLGGRVTANSAIFYQDFENFQVLEFTGVQFETFNVPKAETLGVEVEFNALVTQNLSINGGLTLLDASYPSDCAGNLTSPTVTNLCGETLTNAPETVGVLAARYDRDLAAGLTGFVTGSLRYESERRTSTQATPVGDDNTPLAFDTQDANTKLNLRAGIANLDNDWTAEIWATNLTDERTRAITFDTTLRPGSRSAYLQEPRMFGVTLRKGF